MQDFLRDFMTAFFLAGIFAYYGCDIFVKYLLVDAAVLERVIYAIRIHNDAVARRDVTIPSFYNKDR